MPLPKRCVLVGHVAIARKPRVVKPLGTSYKVHYMHKLCSSKAVQGSRFIAGMPKPLETIRHVERSRERSSIVSEYQTNLINSTETTATPRPRPSASGLRRHPPGGERASSARRLCAVGPTSQTVVGRMTPAHPNSLIGPLELELTCSIPMHDDHR